MTPLIFRSTSMKVYLLLLHGRARAGHVSQIISLARDKFSFGEGFISGFFKSYADVYCCPGVGRGVDSSRLDIGVVSS